METLKTLNLVELIHCRCLQIFSYTDGLWSEVLVQYSHLSIICVNGTQQCMDNPKTKYLIEYRLDTCCGLYVFGSMTEMWEWVSGFQGSWEPVWLSQGDKRCFRGLGFSTAELRCHGEARSMWNQTRQLEWVG